MKKRTVKIQIYLDQRKARTAQNVTFYKDNNTTRNYKQITWESFFRLTELSYRYRTTFVGHSIFIQNKEQ